MNAVMISCVQRRDTERARTLRELAAFGVHPVVTESTCDPAGPSLNRHAAWRAIANAPPGPVLFVEDDITPTERFADAVALAERLDALLDLNFKRRRLLQGARATSERPWTIYRLPRELVEARRGWFGTQAVYLPAQATELVRASRADFVTPGGSPRPVEHGFDFWLKAHAEELGGMHALDPPAAHHRNPTSMRIATRQPGGSSL